MREIDPPARRWAEPWGRGLMFFMLRHAYKYNNFRAIHKSMKEIDPPARRRAEPGGRGKGRAIVLRYCTTVVLCTV